MPHSFFPATFDPLAVHVCRSEPVAEWLPFLLIREEGFEIGARLIEQLLLGILNRGSISPPL